jgi:hypothetical protein
MANYFGFFNLSADNGSSDSRTLSDIASDAINSAGESAKSGANTVGDIANELGSALDNPVNYFENLMSPDGVTSKQELKLNSKKESFNGLSGYAQFDLNQVSGIAPNVLNENTPSTGKVFYQARAQSTEYELPAADGTGNKKTSLGVKPYSVFNKYSLVNYQGSPLFPETGSESKTYNKLSPAAIKNPTATQIIEITDATPGNVGYRYSYSDFALAKYFGRIPNNMMITLRRFAFPCPDDVISPKGPDGVEIPQPDIARAVTWLGEETGNAMSEILKFSHNFEWKDAEAAVQELNSQKGAASGKLGERINNSQFLSAAAAARQGKDAVDLAKQRANAGFDAFSNTYPNHVFGPLNVIKSVLQREQGLKFEQEFTLKFEYELREIGGANPKLLMLDKLSNILALTFNNAPFWGGAVRYISDGSIARPLGNIEQLRSGNYKGFMESVISDLGVGSGSAMDTLKDLVGVGGKALNNMLAGSLMDMFNSPQGGQAVNSLLTGDPTGQWHVTIGNPLNPIMVIGNLACTGTDISFEGNIGPEDFPEKMVVTIKLKPGRPRDKAEIESMFNAGRGRFYLAPDDGVDIDKTLDVSAYGNKDRKANQYLNTFRKITNG